MSREDGLAHWRTVQEHTPSNTEQDEPLPSGWAKGCAVRLLPFEDIGEEHGTLLSDTICNGTVVVQVAEEFLEGPHDDGLRECALEQVALLVMGE